ncbi:hypothetical protein [Brevundimonas sp.]|uniref:hypothetical protein n=1 Tax=Brevundimonas sp. TaxID=1871086 RepID=UPI002FCACD90
MTSAILFMAIVPLALLLVLAFTLLSGRMSETLRKRVEPGLILTVYPALILYWAWQAWTDQQRGDWAGFGLMAGVGCLFAIQFVVALRSRTLFPRYGRPKE